ncbi:chaperonin 10-like protein [Dactylonectria estremocensis]|uniref:Chaperonin 10-like protein n=1 Tax=Dactylonectria estremocensis TaxID=1079267 RepID=A0A9P9J2S0_9HYPO|nr:chaperonin 10-like protein [Dactylonectria estremocensis]
MVQNEAAWITLRSEYPFTVKEGPKPTAGTGEIIIKNAAVSINPVDWKIQAFGRYLSQYPFILGEDAAGFVEEVGVGVTRFKKGDRVVAHCHGLMTGNPANSAFQSYLVADARLVSPIPDSLSFEQAVVLPLAISTAGAGLYPSDRLNIPLPSASKPEKNGKTILIWGGASSVGATAIQLAAASGVTVVTTASPVNHEFVKSIGAHAVFDYRSTTVVEDIASFLAETDFVGVYDAISEDLSFDAVSAILDRLNKKVHVASVLPCNNTTELFAPVYVVAFAIIQEPNQHIGEWIWEKFVPEALTNGFFQAKPDPLVVGHGLKDIQNALDVQRKGVSAKKIVVTL